MQNKIAIVGGRDGLGGLLLVGQCAHYIKLHDPDTQVDLFFSSKNEIFEPLEYLFSPTFHVEHLPPDITEESPEFINIKNKYNEAYFVWPDALFRNPHAFNYKKYNTHPKTIVSTRVLTHLYLPDNKKIYLNLISNTPEYTYFNVIDLITKLCQNLPDYKFYFPVVTKWAGQTINLPNFPKFNNLEVIIDGDFIVMLDLLATCEYGIYTCSGPSHVAFNLGQNRLLLDPQWNIKSSFVNLPWQVRWREDTTDGVPINTEVNKIVSLVKTNLLVPETNLIPKIQLAQLSQAWSIENCDWSYALMFKY